MTDRRPPAKATRFVLATLAGIAAGYALSRLSGDADEDAARPPEAEGRAGAGAVVRQAASGAMMGIVNVAVGPVGGGAAGLALWLAVARGWLPARMQGGFAAPAAPDPWRYAVTGAAAGRMARSVRRALRRVRRGGGRTRR